MVVAVAPMGAVVVVMLIGVTLSNYDRFILTRAAIGTIIATGLVMLVGQARVVSLASGAFAAIGAYSTAILMERYALPYLLAGAMSTVLCFAAGIALGVPSLRFRGHYLTLVTLVFQITVLIAIREWSSVTGGSRGLIFPPVGSLGLGLRGQMVLYIVAFCMCAVVVLCGSLLVRGDFGKALTAIATSEVAAEACSVRPDHYRVLVFGISSSLAGLAGVLLGPLMRVIDPPAFGIFESITHVSMVVIGGMTSIWGGLVGSSLLTLLPEAVRALDEYREVVFSGLLLLVVLTMPDGLVGRLRAAATLALRRSPTLLPRRPVDPVPTPVVPQVNAAGSALPKWERRRATNTLERAEASPVLQCAAVSKSFAGLQAVRAVDLLVRRGEIRALIGPNGAGKSTLLNLITGIERVESGTIRLLGEDITRLRPSARAARGMTRTFQNLQLFSTLTAIDNVRMGMLRFGPMKAMARSISSPFSRSGLSVADVTAIDLLASLGFHEELWLAAGSLSLGHQRRVEIARAVVSRPHLLLLDEPVAGLTDNESAGLGELLQRLVQETGVSLLVVEHTMEFVTDIAQRVTAMVEGAIVAEGPPAHVLAEPVVQHAYFGE